MADSAPTAEQQAQAVQVSQAAAEAIAETTAAGGDQEQARQAAHTAVQRRAQEVHLTMTAEDRSLLIDELIERLNALGAFDSPPASAPTTEVQPAPEVAAEAAAEVAAVAAPPRKQTWAEKHFGGR